MPIIHVDLLAGRPQSLRQALAEKLTATAVDVLGVEPGTVRVLLREIAPEDWFVGGRPMQPPRPPQSSSPSTNHSSRRRSRKIR